MVDSASLFRLSLLSGIPFERALEISDDFSRNVEEIRARDELKDKLKNCSIVIIHNHQHNSKKRKKRR